MQFKHKNVATKFIRGFILPLLLRALIVFALLVVRFLKARDYLLTLIQFSDIV